MAAVGRRQRTMAAESSRLSVSQLQGSLGGYGSLLPYLLYDHRLSRCPISIYKLDEAQCLILAFPNSGSQAERRIGTGT